MTERTSGTEWTVETLRIHMSERLAMIESTHGARLEDLRAMLLERYATQTKAVDAAFVAQQTAMRTALESAERAVALALLSAEKAVTKAEAAAERRFESVNEFRSQLTDQAATFMPRTESTARHEALSERLNIETTQGANRVGAVEVRVQNLVTRQELQVVLDGVHARRIGLDEQLGKLESRVTSRLDTTAGRSAGLNQGWVYLLGALAAVGTVVGLLMTFRTADTTDTPTPTVTVTRTMPVPLDGLVTLD